MEITRGFRDRIQRAGGMVLVTAVGAVAITAASGRAATMSANGGSVVVSAAGAITATPASGQDFSIKRNDGNTAVLMSGASGGVTMFYNNTVAGTFTVTGAGPHPFSGPVKVSGAGGTISNAFQVVVTDSAGTTAFSSWRGSDRRFNLALENTTNDTVLYTVTGSGSGTPTESLRFINASGYAQFASRVGVGVSPSYPLHVSGQSYLTGSQAAQTLYSENNNGGGQAAWFQQKASSAIVPVVVIKLGSTPGAGGDALQVQNSSGTSLFKLLSNGGFEGNQVVTNALGGSVVNNQILTVHAGSATVIPLAVRGASSQSADLQRWQTSAPATVAYVNSAGTISTIAGNLRVRNAADDTTLTALTTDSVYWDSSLSQTTVGAAGAASALPANPTGYAKINVGGTNYVVPYYAAA